MPHVAWTPAAEEDLEGVFLYIGREQGSAHAAVQVVRDIVAKTDFYSSQPLLAAARPEFGATIRSFHMHRYVIFYRPTRLGIEIIRVIHGSRDVYRVFHGQTP